MASKGNNSTAWSVISTAEISLVSLEDAFHLAPPTQEIQKSHQQSLEIVPTGVCMAASLTYRIFPRHLMKTICCWCLDLWNLDPSSQQHKEAYIFITQAPHASMVLAIFHHPNLVFRQEVSLLRKHMRIRPHSPVIQVLSHNQQSHQLHMLHGSSTGNSSGSLLIWTRWVLTKKMRKKPWSLKRQV